MTPASDREADRLAVQAEAEAYAAEHGMAADDGPPRVAPTPAGLVRLYGGPEHASKALGNLPASGGLRITSVPEMDAQAATMQAFWAHGGGRFPDEFQPRKPDAKPLARGQWPREWADGRTWTLSGELVQ